MTKLNKREISESEFKQAVQASSARNTDWFKLLFRNSFSMNHSIGLSGGNDKSSWYSSFSYSKANGTAKEDELERFTADVRLNAHIGKRLRTEFIINANHNTSTGYATSITPLTYAIQTNRAISPDVDYDWRYGNTGTVEYDPVTYNFLRDVNNTNMSNKAQSASAILNLHYDLGAGFRLDHSSSATADAAESFKGINDISPTASILRGWDFGLVVPQARIDGSVLPYGGVAGYSNLNTQTFNTRNSLNYSKMLFRSRDQFNFTLGSEISSSHVKGHITQEPGYYPDRGMVFDANDKSRRQLSLRQLLDMVDNKVGVYATTAYNMMGRYTLGFTARSDGSNRFGQYSNARFLPNYSASFRWDVTQEKWLKSSRWLDRFQIRTSYGTQGNVVTEVGPELIVRFEEAKDGPTINGRPRVLVKSLPYPDLRWEKTYQFNLGTDISLFHNRLNLQVDWYRKHGIDLITRRDVPIENGVSNIYVNAGSMNNNGIEVVVNVVAVQRKDLKVALTFLNSFNDNKVADKGYKNQFIDYLNGTAYEPGVPLSGFYSMVLKGLNGQTGLPEFAKLEGDGKGMKTTDLLTYSGKKIPDFFGTIAPNITYKNFSLSGTFYYSIGTHKRLNPLYARIDATNGIPQTSSNASRELIGRWRKPGDEKYTDVPVLKDLTTADYIVFPALAAGPLTTQRSPIFYTMYQISA